VAGAISAERARLGLSQEELARKIGASRESVRLWERNTDSITAKNIKKLSRFFGVTADYLISSSSNPHSNA
jgi:transcriptional regulator with XRE-family HTH domain